MILEVASLLLISLGCVMMFTAALGLFRFTSIYMRLHASGKAGTGGTIAILAGVLMRSGMSQISGKVLLVMIFILFTGPITAHAIGRAAHIESEATTDVPFHNLEIEEGGDEDAN